MNGEVVGLENKIEEDHFTSAMRLQYQWRHWLTVFVQYNFDNFDSTQGSNDYDLQTASLGIVAKIL